MRRLYDHICRFVQDEYGGDAIEYALVAGLIVLLFIGAFIQMANGVGSTFNLVEDGVTSS